MFRAYNSKGVDKNGAKMQYGFGRITKIYQDTRDNGHCVWQILEKIKDIFERAAKKLANISGGVKNPDILKKGEGPKWPKFHYGVKTSRK